MDLGGSQTGGTSSALVRSAVRVSRTRWFRFLRRVYRYQNEPRPDVARNPFNSRRWLALESAVVFIQIVGITTILTISGKEKPLWPLRVWACGYDVLNVLSLPLLFWRCRCSAAWPPGRGDSDDVEQQQTTLQESRSSSVMNKSKGFLDLFFALWFVLGNVWILDTRYVASPESAPNLHALCVVLLVWNAILYAFPLFLFLLLCCCVPSVGRILGYDMNLGSVAPGASDHEIHMLPNRKFKEARCSSTFLADSATCCICLSNYRDDEDVRVLPCSHIFHTKCVDQWLRIISCCPLCKHEIGRYN